MVIFGKSGIGKTSLLWTLDAASTLFLDMEAGDLAIEGWPGASVRPRTWIECRDFAVFIGGPNPAVAGEGLYGQQHYEAVCGRLMEKIRRPPRKPAAARFEFGRPAATAADPAILKPSDGTQGA